MADAPDRPADKGVLASIPEAPPPPGATGEGPPAYSSVSVVAVVGFILAVLYAAVVGLGGLFALFNHTPWILPIWTLVFPVVAAGVCWAARTQIRNSEGALTGTRLTTWGVGLSAAVGLLYAAYYAGCYVAVSSQATNFANQWLGLLKAGKIDQAFLYTQAPDKRPADDDRLRDRLELDFDRGPEGGTGALTTFRQSEIVCQFAQGGDAQIQLLGVRKWGFDQGGYVVELTYRVTTAGMVSEIVVPAVGMDDESGERQWYVKEAQPLKEPALTSEGERMTQWNGQARAFAQEWLAKVAAAGWDNAYLDTLPPSDRERQKNERDGTPFKDSLKTFKDGGVVHFDPETFWVGPKEQNPAKEQARQDNQKKIAAKVKALFGPDVKDVSQWDWTLSRTPWPAYSRNGDLVRLAYDLEITLGEELIQGRLVLAADVAHGDPVKEQWRVESLDLLSAKSMAGGPGGIPGRPSRPQPPRP